MSEPSIPRPVWIVLVDAEERRREELGSYHAVCRTLDRESKRLKDFEDHEMPAFQTWLEAEFADELTQLHEWSAHMSSLELLIDDVERYVAWKNVSRRVALATIEDAHTDGRYQDLWAELADELADAEAREEEFRQEYEKNFGAEEPAEESYRESRSGAERAPRVENSAAENYIKALYRRLVRELHPDALGGLSEAQRRLWQEVQDAYEWRDVSRLERLHQAIVKSGKDAVDLKDSPISDLMALRKTVEANLKRIRSKIRGARKHIAWGFRKVRTNAGKLTKLRRDIGKDIAHDLALVRMRREELEEILERWRAVPKARAKERRRDVRARER